MPEPTEASREKALRLAVELEEWSSFGLFLRAKACERAHPDVVRTEKRAKLLAAALDEAREEGRAELAALREENERLRQERDEARATSLAQHLDVRDAARVWLREHRPMGQTLYWTTANVAGFAEAFSALHVAQLAAWEKRWAALVPSKGPEYGPCTTGIILRRAEYLEREHPIPTGDEGEEATPDE